MGNWMYWLLGVLWFCLVTSWKVSAQGKNFTEKVDGVEFEMIYVKGGTFRMGATEEQGSDAYSDEYPVHEVTLSDYYIGKFEVTQELWEKVMGTTIIQQIEKSVYKTGVGIGSNYPMSFVSWNEAVAFCEKLCELTGKNYALPTEAQWEYAARGGKNGCTSVHVWCGSGAIAFSGTISTTKYSGSDDIDKVAWYYYTPTPHPVGTKQPNALGIYDMSGNVGEWCSDWYGAYDSDAQTNPMGPASGRCRVCRGGNWNRETWLCRVSSRHNVNWTSCDSDLDFRSNLDGIRVVLVP